MEIGFRRIFLILVAGSCLHATVSAASDVPSLDELQEVESVIQPDMARVQFDESGIETGDFELGISTDSLSLEALRVQVALAGVPALHRMSSGVSKGKLRYRVRPGSAGE